MIRKVSIFDMPKAWRVDLFWSRVGTYSLNECWPYLGCIDKHGYGHVSIRTPFGILWRAHRAAFYLATGVYPQGFLLHRCDNRLCCNPHHLWLGTNDDNMADMVSKGRQVKGGRAKNASLTDKQAEEIRRLWRFHCRHPWDIQTTQAALARRFQTGTGTICCVVNGRSYCE
jgi:hypothetical protein